MTLKSTLKSLKLNESSISMLLGGLVIIVLGVLLFNYFRGREVGKIPTADNQAATERSTAKTHKVAAGESLWTIAQDNYGDGYKWVDIANENNIESPNNIEVNQELTLPAVVEEPKEPTMEVDIEEKPAPPVAEVQEQPEEMTQEESSIAGATYTVVRGDNLWEISIRAYGDGYKWVEIARENELANPDIIHAGNVLTLPR